MKINYDRAVFRETNEVGHRAIVRDNEGRVLASLAKKIPLPQSVVDVEVTAARRALILAKELQFNSIVLEGDSAIITRALQAEDCLWHHLEISSWKHKAMQKLSIVLK